MAGLNYFSFPGTEPAHQDPVTREVTVLVDNVQLLLESGPRAFNAGDVVALTEWEFQQIEPAKVGPNNDLRSISWGTTTITDATVATSADLNDIVLPIPLGSSFLARDTNHVWQYLAHPGSLAVNGFVDLGVQVTSFSPLRLYAISGHTATLPPGENVLATFADMAALSVAVIPLGQAELIQVAIDTKLSIYQSKLEGSDLVWQLYGHAVNDLPDYTITADTTSRTFNADTATVAQLADVVATLIKDLGGA